MGVNQAMGTMSIGWWAWGSVHRLTAQHCPGWAWCWDMLGRCCTCCVLSTHVQKHIHKVLGI